MNGFDWTAIEAANAAKARFAATPPRMVAGGNHAECDHANQYCALTLDNVFSGVSA